jgi:hypothetical protein
MPASRHEEWNTLVLAQALRKWQGLLAGGRSRLSKKFKETER